jgi:hypothetical protein
MRDKRGDAKIPKFEKIASPDFQNLCSDVNPPGKVFSFSLKL